MMNCSKGISNLPSQVAPIMPKITNQTFCAGNPPKKRRLLTPTMAPQNKPSLPSQTATDVKSHQSPLSMSRRNSHSATAATSTSAVTTVTLSDDDDIDATNTNNNNNNNNNNNTNSDSNNNNKNTSSEMSSNNNNDNNSTNNNNNNNNNNNKNKRVSRRNSHSNRNSNNSNNNDELNDGMIALNSERGVALYSANVGVCVEYLEYALNRLVIYGISTSIDVAKLQPWQLRVLKKEFDFIDGIYLYAFRSYGNRFMIDTKEHKRNEQFNSPAIWLEYNEIQLICKSFDNELRGYRCFVCGASDGMTELDILRWHLWRYHKQSSQFLSAVDETKPLWQTKSKSSITHINNNNNSNNNNNNNTNQISPATASTKSTSNAPSNVISLIDDSDEEDDIDILAQNNNNNTNNNNDRKTATGFIENSKNNKNSNGNTRHIGNENGNILSGNNNKNMTRIKSQSRDSNDDNETDLRASPASTTTSSSLPMPQAQSLSQRQIHEQYMSNYHSMNNGMNNMNMNMNMYMHGNGTMMWNNNGLSTIDEMTGYDTSCMDQSIYMSSSPTHTHHHHHHHYGVPMMTATTATTATTTHHHHNIHFDEENENATMSHMTAMQHFPVSQIPMPPMPPPMSQEQIENMEKIKSMRKKTHNHASKSKSQSANNNDNNNNNDSDNDSFNAPNISFSKSRDGTVDINMTDEMSFNTLLQLPSLSDGSKKSNSPVVTGDSHNNNDHNNNNINSRNNSVSHSHTRSAFYDDNDMESIANLHNNNNQSPLAHMSQNGEFAPGMASMLSDPDFNFDEQSFGSWDGIVGHKRSVHEM